MSAAREESELYLHPYICEGCFQDYPLTLHQYEKAMDYRGRLLCETCLEKKLSRTTKPQRVETLPVTTRRRSGGNPDVTRTTTGPPRRSTP